MFHKYGFLKYSCIYLLWSQIITFMFWAANRTVPWSWHPPLEESLLKISSPRTLTIFSSHIITVWYTLIQHNHIQYQISVLLLLTKSKTKYDLDIFHEIHPAILYTNIQPLFRDIFHCWNLSHQFQCVHSKNTKQRKRYQFLYSYQSALYIFYEIVYNIEKWCRVLAAAWNKCVFA